MVNRMGAFTSFPPASGASAWRKFSPTLLGIASLLCFTVLPSAHAETYVPAIRFNPLKTKSISGTGNLLGYHFTTEEKRTIKGVGIWHTTPSNNRLGIWDYSSLSTDLLFQVLLPNPSNCVDGYCWISADELPGLPVLEKDRDYVIAVSWNGSSVPANMNQEDLLLIAGFSTPMNAYLYPDRMSNLNDDLMSYYPDSTNLPDKKAFFTAMLSFGVRSDTVQTPAPLPLFGAAAAFGWTRKIRSRIKPSI